jgi:hypothetical protein
MRRYAHGMDALTKKYKAKGKSPLLLMFNPPPAMLKKSKKGQHIRDQWQKAANKRARANRRKRVRIAA